MSDIITKPELAALRKGDADAVARLWQELREPSLRLAYYFTSSWDDAEDVFQIAMLKALEHLERFDDDGSFSAWFRRILVNTCYDWRKEAWRRLRSMLSEVQWGQLAATPAFEEDSDIQRHIGQLSRRMRMVFILRDLEGYAVREIAEILSISEDTVRVLSMQARRRIREAAIDEN